MTAAIEGPGGAVNETQKAIGELHRPHRYFEAAAGAEEPDVDCQICDHCSDLANTPVAWPCPTAVAAGLAQPTETADMPVTYSEEAPF